MIRMINLFILNILALTHLSLINSQEIPEETEILSKHFFKAFSLIKSQIVLADFLQESDLYGFSINNNLNVQQHAYEVFFII